MDYCSEDGNFSHVIDDQGSTAPIDSVFEDGTRSGSSDSVDGRLSSDGEDREYSYNRFMPVY